MADKVFGIDATVNIDNEVQKFVDGVNTMASGTEAAVGKMNVAFDGLINKLNTISGTLSGDIPSKLAQLGNLANGRPINAGSGNISDQLSELDKFDAELKKCISNLTNYFSSLREQWSAYEDMLKGAKASLPSASSVDTSTLKDLNGVLKSIDDTLREIAGHKKELETNLTLLSQMGAEVNKPRTQPRVTRTTGGNIFENVESSLASKKASEMSIVESFQNGLAQAQERVKQAIENTKKAAEELQNVLSSKAPSERTEDDIKLINEKAAALKRAMDDAEALNNVLQVAQERARDYTFGQGALKYSPETKDAVSTSASSFSRLSQELVSANTSAAGLYMQTQQISNELNQSANITNEQINAEDGVRANAEKTLDTLKQQNDARKEGINLDNQPRKIGDLKPTLGARASEFTLNAASEKNTLEAEYKGYEQENAYVASQLDAVSAKLGEDPDNEILDQEYKKLLKKQEELQRLRDDIEARMDEHAKRADKDDVAFAEDKIASLTQKMEVLKKTRDELKTEVKELRDSENPDDKKAAAERLSEVGSIEKQMSAYYGIIGKLKENISRAGESGKADKLVDEYALKDLARSQKAREIEKLERQNPQNEEERARIQQEIETKKQELQELIREASNAKNDAKRELQMQSAQLTQYSRDDIKKEIEALQTRRGELVDEFNPLYDKAKNGTATDEELTRLHEIEEEHAKIYTQIKAKEYLIKQIETTYAKEIAQQETLAQKRQEERERLKEKKRALQEITALADKETRNDGMEGRFGQLAKKAGLTDEDLQMLKKDLENELAAQESADAKLKRLKAKEGGDVLYGESGLTVDEALKKTAEETMRLQDEQRVLNKIIDETKQKHVSIRTQMMQCREQMISMREAGQQNTKEYGELAQRMGSMRKQLALVNAEMQYFATPNRGMLLTKTALQGMASAASAAVGALGLFNTKNETMIKLQTKVQSLMGIIIGLEGTYNTMKRTSVVLIATTNVQRALEAKSEALVAAAKDKGTFATIRATIAQKAFNAIAKMNPYVFLFTAIMTVVGAVYLLAKAFKSANQESESTQRINDKLTEEFKSQSSQVASNITTFELLKRKWGECAGDMDAKKKFITDNKDEFKKLGLEVNTVSDAENVLVTNANAVAQSFILKAKAAAYSAAIQSEYALQIAKVAELERKIQKGEPLNVEEYETAAKAGMSKKSVKLQNFDLFDFGTWKSAIEDQYTVNDKNDVIKSFRKGVEDSVTINTKSLQDGLLETEEQLNALKKFVPQLKDNPYANNKSGSKGGKNDAKKVEEQVKQHLEKINDLEKKYGEKRLEIVKSITEKLSDLRIKGERNQLKREQMEREQAFRKELEDLQKQRQDYIKSQAELYKQIFDEKQKLEKTKNPKYQEQKYEGSAQQQQDMLAIVRDANKIIADINVDDIVSNPAKALETLTAKENELQASIAKAKDEAIAQMNALNLVGNVDLLNRPVVDALKLTEAGWGDQGEGTSSTFARSYTIADANGTSHNVLITPILPDGSVLSPQEIDEYITKMLSGKDILQADDKKIVIGLDVDAAQSDTLRKAQGVLNDQTPSPYALAISTIRANQVKRDEEVDKNLLEKFRSIEQERAAIAKEYDDDITRIQQERANVQQRIDAAITEEERKELQERSNNLIAAEAKAQQERNKALGNFDFEQLKNNPQYMKAFGNLEELSDTTLTRLVKLFEEATSDTTLDPEVLKQYADVLQALNEQVDARNPFKALMQARSKMLDSMAKASGIEKEIKNLQKLRKQAVENGESAEKLTEIDSALNEKEKELADTHDELVKNQKDVEKSLTEISNQTNELANAIKSVGDAMGGTAGEVLGLIGDIMTFTTTTIEGIEKAAQTGTTALSTMEKASVILTIISVAIQLLQKISDMYKDAHAQYEDYAEKVGEINTLTKSVHNYRLAVLDAMQAEKTWFATTGLQGLKNAYERGQEVLQAYNDTLNEQQAVYQNESGGGWLTKGLKAIGSFTASITGAVTSVLGLGKTAGAIFSTVMSGGTDFMSLVGAVTEQTDQYTKNTVAAYENLRIETRKKSSGFLGTGIGGHSQQTEDLRTWAKEKYGEELFDTAGWINTELAETILEDYGDKLVGETEKTLNDLIELKEEYDAWKEELQSYVSDMFSPLVDDMSDALFDWLADGKDVMDSFHEYASDTFRSLAQEILKQALLKQVFAGFEDNLNDIYTKYAAGGLDEKQMLDEVMSEVDAVTTRAEKNLPSLQALTEYINQKFKDSGYDLTGDSYDQEASTGAYETMSEDTGLALEGRFTALQESNEIIKQNVILLEASCRTININNDAIRGYVSEIADIQRGTASYVSDIAKFTTLYLPKLQDISDNTRKILEAV